MAIACNDARMNIEVSPTRSDVRVGDAERDACMGALTEHHVRGRLTVEELDRRQLAALGAVTQTDLTALLADLPADESGTNPATFAEEWWSSEPRDRAVRMARWAATPASIVAGGVLSATFSNNIEESQFLVGCAAAAVGYLTHLAVTRWPYSEGITQARRRQQDQHRRLTSAGRRPPTDRSL